MKHVPPSSVRVEAITTPEPVRTRPSCCSTMIWTDEGRMRSRTSSRVGSQTRAILQPLITNAAARTANPLRPRAETAGMLRSRMIPPFGGSANRRIATWTKSSDHGSTSRWHMPCSGKTCRQESGRREKTTQEEDQTHGLSCTFRNDRRLDGGLLGAGCRAGRRADHPDFTSAADRRALELAQLAEHPELA